MVQGSMRHEANGIRVDVRDLRSKAGKLLKFWKARGRNSGVGGHSELLTNWSDFVLCAR